MARDSRNLGDLLLDEGVISRGDLDRALMEQLILGMRLGSSLVALRLATLDPVSRCLGIQLGRPHASAADFAHVDPRLLVEVPAEICTRYRAFPLRQRGRVLDLAMVEPHRLDLVDEVMFSLGRPVRPHAALELQLLYHLERRYGLDTDRPRPRAGGGFDVQSMADARPARPTTVERPVPREPAPEPAAPRDPAEPPGATLYRRAPGAQGQTLPSIVQRMLPLFEQGLTVDEVCRRCGVPNPKGQVIVDKLCSRGVLLLRRDP